MLKYTPIKIAIKIKPSLAQTSYNIQPGANRITCTFKSHKKKVEAIEASVDYIHDANSKNKNVSAFRDLQLSNLVEQFCQGYNATVIAYGQTGSGKTYLMEGSDTKSNRQKGIIQQAVLQIYKQKKTNCLISCSFVEIYNQKIYDLLSDSKMENPLRLRWQPQMQFLLQDLQPKVCQNDQQMMQWYEKGRNNRIMASSKVQQRSHCLFTIMIQDIDGQGYYRSRQLTFVDLAGSELPNGQSKISKESIQINKSLFFLRKVIKQLQEHHQQRFYMDESRIYCRDERRQFFIPYRNSKLTSLLKRSLGGNCLTLIVACVCPQQSNFEQTVSSLSYIASAGKIHNQPSIQYDKKSSEIKYLKQYNAKLKKQLEISRRQIDKFQNLFKNQHPQKNQLNSQLIQCISTVRQLLQTNKELREQVESQKQKSKSHLKEISQLVRINRDYKNSMRSQSLMLNQKKKHSVGKIYQKNVQDFQVKMPGKFSMSPYLSSPVKTQPSNSVHQGDMNKTQIFRSRYKKNKFQQSILRKQTSKQIEKLNNSSIRLSKIKGSKMSLS